MTPTGIYLLAAAGLGWGIVKLSAKLILRLAGHISEPENPITPETTQAQPSPEPSPTREPDPEPTDGQFELNDLLIGKRIGRVNAWRVDPRVPRDSPLYRAVENQLPEGPIDFDIPRELQGSATIKASVRNRGVYIIGKTGTGKSTLAELMARQDLLFDRGMAFIDPHGKHAQRLLDYVPKHRVDDTIYFEPKEYPTPIDLFDAHDEDEANELASDVTAMFKKLSDDFGQQMDTILKFAVHTLVRARKYMAVTFMDLELLLTDETYLKKCLQYVKHEAILHFWEEEYPAFKRKDSTLAIVRRMTDFRLSSVLPIIFGEEGLRTIKQKLDVRRIMDEQKILLVNLGKVLPDDARIIGTFLVTKIQLVLPRREKSTPFFLYVDELDEFAASPFQKIITKCRKHEIGLTVMNQGFYQIKNEQNRKAIKSIDTKVIFRVDGDDARLLKDDIAPFDPEIYIRA